MATTSTRSTATTLSAAELERLERRMERRWYDLAMAEQRGQPVHALERMYDAYVRAMDEFLAYSKALAGRPTLTRLAS
jgi:hypothetical protein